uniref:Uncharacterized protein n=1 Tax=Solanum tuberosum TaxID=4113 RepID=M1DRS8_SOLTU
MVKKKIPRITPKKGDSDSDFIDSPPKTSNFSQASTLRYPIRSKDNFKGKQCESIGVVDKKIKKIVISVEVARRRRIIESDDEEDDDHKSAEAKVLICNRKESAQKTVKKRRKNAKFGKARRRKVIESVVDNRVLKVFRNFLDSSEEIEVKSSKCGSDLIDKAEEQKKIIQRRKEDIIQECKLVKDDGEDIILRNRIEKLSSEFNLFKKLVEQKLLNTSGLDNTNHESGTSYKKGVDDEKYSDDDIGVFKSNGMQNNESGTSYKKGVDDEKYLDDDIGVSKSNGMQNNEDVIQFENSSNGNNKTCQIDVVEKFEDNK